MIYKLGRYITWEMIRVIIIESTIVENGNNAITEYEVGTMRVRAMFDLGVELSVMNLGMVYNHSRISLN